jgi:glycerol-3-phosphate dehydrogenase
MTTLQTEVLVVGGGATGAGIAWDAALRGYDVILVDRGDLAEGTSGRFHGLLHSGGRYVVKDPVAARECIVENEIVRGVAAAVVEDTGGLFVTTPDDDPAYGDRFLAGCREAGVPAEEIDVAEALRAEPRLNPGIRRAFTVPDASIDVWQLVWGLANGASARGARILPYHRCTALHRDGDAVTGAELHDERTGETVRVEAGFTINAGGAWAHEIAEMAGIEGVSVVPGKGIMIAMNHRLVNTVVNRCTMPADGDILVPIRTVSVIGTTDIKSAHPDDLPVTQEEVDQMLEDGERLVPGLRAARALRVWAGVRPLFDDKKAGEGGSTRDVSRGTALLDHRERDGVDRFITITGGKLTTYRLMAEEAVDAMVEQLGDDRPCTTKSTPLPGSEDGEYMSPGARLRARDQHLKSDQLICECELIERSTLEATMVARGSRNLDDIRRSLRLGMGPCQGGFCIYRATGILHGLDRLDGAEASASLRRFLEERWKGVWPILHGDQLRQARLDDWIFQGVLDVEHLPGDVEADDAATAGTGVRMGSARNGDLQPTPGAGSAHETGAEGGA